MKKVTLVIDEIIYKDIKDYLFSLNGIKDVQIDFDKSSIEIAFDEKQISYKIIKYEVFIFLNILHIPVLAAFDKHSSNKLKKYDIVIKDLCCEYCLCGMVADLYEINGIEKADCNIDVNIHKRDDAIINIEYDDSIISENRIKELEIEYNK